MDYFIKPKDIFSTLIKVKSEILEEVLNEFLLTSLKKNNIKLYSNSKIFYTYLKQANYYQISTFKTKNKKPILEFELICSHINSLNDNFNNTTEDNYVLCLLQDYFVLFKNSEIYYYQKKSNEMTGSEIKSFLEKKFFLIIKKEYLIEENTLNEFKSKFNINSFESKTLYISKTSFFSFKFLLIILCLCFFLFYYSNNLFFTKNKNILNSLHNEYKNLQKEKKNKNYISLKLLDIYLEIQKSDMKITKLIFENKNISLDIISKKRIFLYDFMKNYQNSVISSINKNGSDYEIHAKIYF